MRLIFRYLAAIILLTAFTATLKAQDDKIMLGLRAGHNAVFGGFAAVSLETVQTIDEDFSIIGGLQYNSIGKTALEACPAYSFSFPWGNISAQMLLSYSNMTSVNNIAAGAGALLTSRWFGCRLGYYYRLYGGKSGYINEPFNIYYELCANLLPMIDDWDLQLFITNCELFELERHYQPTFLVQCNYYPFSNIGFNVGLGCKPAGMFHLSADYYQSFMKLGVCYRW